MVAFAFRPSALLLPWLCAGLPAAVLADDTHAFGLQQHQTQVRVGTNRYLQEVALTSVLTSTPSSAPSYATEYATVAALNLLVSADSIMDTATIAMFEEECTAFLPVFLPAVYPGTFQFVKCELLGQSLLDMPEQGEQDLKLLAVLVEVSARANLPDSIRFNDLVGQVFGTFGSTLQSNLKSALPYFGATSTVTRLPISEIPSVGPSHVPSDMPSNVPSHVPNAAHSGSPSDIPSQVPSVAVTFSPSDGPSRVPNAAPSGFPSDIPSQVPSVTFNPSDGPSHVPNASPSGLPSDIPSVAPSVTFSPSDGPSNVPNAAPSGFPSDIPSQVPSVTFNPSDGPSHVPNASPSGLPSDVPSQVPSVAPSVTFSAAISDFPSGVPSDVPSGAPSGIPSGRPSDIPSLAPSLVPGATPTLKESGYASSSPPTKPSGTPTFVAPIDLELSSYRPSGAPSRSSLPTDTPSTAPSYGTEYVAVDALNLIVSADSIMNKATISMFEEECAAFLPAFLPLVYPATFQFVECELLGQSLVDMPASRRQLKRGEQEGEQESMWLAVLVRVSARADLPSNISFNNLVGQVFVAFGSTLQLNLNSALPYFGNASTLVSGTFSSSTRGDTGSDDQTKNFPIILVVAAVVVGTVFAIGMAAFILFVKRRRTDGAFPRLSTTDSIGSFIIDGGIDDDDQKMGTQLSESTNGIFLPPTPIGVYSVPNEFDSESFVESEIDLSPDSTSSTSREVSNHQSTSPVSRDTSKYQSTSSASRDTSKCQYPASSPHVLGLGRTGTNFDRSKSVRQGSARAMATVVEPKRSFDSTYVDDIDRSLHAVRRKTRDEGKLDMDVMKFIRSDSASISVDNETLATVDDAKDQLVVNPSAQMNFFGAPMGGDYACD
jgi:hypothetical protein